MSLRKNNALALPTLGPVGEAGERIRCAGCSYVREGARIDEGRGESLDVDSLKRSEPPVLLWRILLYYPTGVGDTECVALLR